MLSLTRWNPLEELTNLHREVDRVFGPSWGEITRGNGSFWAPASEVTSDKDGWTVRLALPGLDPKDVHVDLDGRVLTVSGERTHSEKETGEPYLSEIGYGRFERRFTLPENVDREKVDARFTNGLLELRLPVSEAAKPRRIAITAGQAKDAAA